MAVDQAAHLVGDRLVEIVAGDEHGVDRGDRAARRSRRRARPAAAAARTRSADSRGARAARRPTARPRAARARRGSASRRAAARARRGARGTTRRSRSRRATARSADERRRVAGRAHDDGARARRRELVAEELGELAAALADQAQHDDVGRGAARDLRRAASTCRRRRPRTARRAGRGRASAARRSRARRSASGAVIGGRVSAGRRRRDRPPSARRSSGGPPSIGAPSPSSTRPSRSSPQRIASGSPVRHTALAGRDAGELAERQQHRLLAAKADDLGGQRRAAARDRSCTTSPSATPGDRRAHDEADDLVDLALASDDRLGRRALGRRARCARAGRPRAIARGLGARVGDDLLGARASVELVAADHASGLHRGPERITGERLKRRRAVRRAEPRRAVVAGDPLVTATGSAQLSPARRVIARIGRACAQFVVDDEADRHAAVAARSRAARRASSRGATARVPIRT